MDRGSRTAQRGAPSEATWVFISTSSAPEASVWWPRKGGVRTLQFSSACTQHLRQPWTRRRGGQARRESDVSVAKGKPANKIQRLPKQLNACAWRSDVEKPLSEPNSSWCKSADMFSKSCSCRGLRQEPAEDPLGLMCLCSIVDFRSAAQVLVALRSSQTISVTRLGPNV